MQFTNQRVTTTGDIVQYATYSESDYEEKLGTLTAHIIKNLNSNR